MLRIHPYISFSLGNVQRVHARQAPLGVHSRYYKVWRERPSIFRIPTAGFKASSINIYHAQEDHKTNSKSLEIQSPYLNPSIPETQYSNFPQDQVSYFKSGFNSVSPTQGQSSVEDDRSGNKAFTSFDGKKIHPATFGSVFGSGAVQVPPLINRARTKLTGGFSPVQVDKAPKGFGQNNRKARIYAHSKAASPNIKDIKSSLKPVSHKLITNPSRPHHDLQESCITIRLPSGYQPASAFPNSLLQKDLKPINKMNSIVKGRSAGTSLAEKIDTQKSSPAWSPRFYSSAAMPEARGYAHVRHIKPKPQASSAAARKFLESGSRGNHQDSWHPPAPERAQVPVQGKFKPFQRLPINADRPVHTNSSDRESASSQTSAGTTLPPSLISTGNISSVVPSVNEELSTKSASPLQTEGKDVELEPQASNSEGQTESVAEVGDSLDQNKPLTVSPPTLKPVDEEEGDMVASSPREKNESEV